MSLPSGLRMTTVFAPPTRTSSSACGVVYGAGANHCFSSSASVHARYSFSRGASIRRVSTRSRSPVMQLLHLCLSCPKDAAHIGLPTNGPKFLSLRRAANELVEVPADVRGLGRSVGQRNRLIKRD